MILSDKHARFRFTVQLEYLSKLVQQYTKAPRWSKTSQAMTKPVVDWIAIGKELTRTPAVCCKRWNKLKRKLSKISAMPPINDPASSRAESSSEPGSGSDSEPELVLRESDGASNTERLTQCETPSSKGRSLWTQEQVKINNHYLYHLFVHKLTIRVVKQDERLREGVALHRAEGWQRVAEFVGDGKSRAQCQVRWSVYGSRGDDSMGKGVPWSEADVSALTVNLFCYAVSVFTLVFMLQVERLRALVQKHTVAPRWSKQTKSMTRELIDWISIEKELGRGAHHCKNKWKYVKNQPGGAPLLPTHFEEQEEQGSEDEVTSTSNNPPENSIPAQRAQWTAQKVQ